MNFPLIVIERSNSVATIRLKRPEKSNALSREMVLSLSDIFTNLESEPDIRAVVLTGTEVFCAGTDIAELAELTTIEASEASKRGQNLCNQIERCGVPVIAAVDGIAAGGGCELALACHIRIASPNATF